jgi:hypothetical protein
MSRLVLWPPKPKELDMAYWIGAAGDVGDVVEVALGVGFVVVDGGGEVGAGEGEAGDDQFDAAGGAQGEADFLWLN